MIDILIAIGIIAVLVLGPLAWRTRYDRLTARGLLLHADVDAAVRHALGGESFVSVHVVPSTAWRRGRVILAAPTGWAWLIERSWKRAAAATPADYDLVIRGAAGATPAPAAPARLRVAA